MVVFGLSEIANRQRGPKIIERAGGVREIELRKGQKQAL